MSDDSFLYGLEKLEQTIGFGFQNIEYLKLALTHRSFGPEHNERLEYLGDSIVGMIIAKKLYDMFPRCPEGDLTRMRSTLVRETTLAEIAREFGIGGCLRLGPGEMKSGGARRDSLLADAVESIIGAIFLDTNENFDLVRQVVLRWFDSRLKVIKPNVNQKDPKSALQEFLQGEHRPLPHYSIDKIIGADNNQTFFVSVKIEGVNGEFKGRGSSRRRAEQEAAEKALEAVRSQAKK